MSPTEPHQGGPTELGEYLGFVETVSWDPETTHLVQKYQASMAMCHSGGIVQGGFVTAWIDATMAHAVLHKTNFEVSPLSLELKVTFLKAAGPGPVFAEAWIEKMGRSIAFLEGYLTNEAGEVLAKCTSTTKLVSIKPS